MAHWLYLRYFLARGLLQYDLKHVMLACIFLATKMENLHLTGASFAGRIPNCQPELIAWIEIDLLEALGFNLHFFHPHSALQGLGLVFKTKQDVMTGAQMALDQLVMTDALLVETPSHLALAALFSVIPEQVSTYIQSVLCQAIDCDGLQDRLGSIARYVQPPTPFDTAVLKDIDKRLQASRASF